MKILLVTRGSHGDIFPYLSIADELKNRGHNVTISLPKLFEEEAKPYNLNYIIQEFDDITRMMDDATERSVKLGAFLKWTRDVIDIQFSQLVPLLQEADLLISTNTEFAATSIAECCNKPIIRTTYAPFLPGKKIPPPIFPYPNAKPPFVAFLWKCLNTSANMMVVKRLNKNRTRFNLPPIKNFGHHAAEKAQNTMLYSPSLGTTDSEWKYQWGITGYCFNDTFQYDKEHHEELMRFVKKDTHPTIFFTFGSCNSKFGKRFVEMLSNVCKENDYKLVIGAGWAKTGLHLEGNGHLFIMRKPIPHHFIFSSCDAIIHHGGCGTTHNVTRSGKPQMIVPLIIDQHYWGNRTHKLGLGPKQTNVKKVSKKALEKRVHDLMNNLHYKENAAKMAQTINAENGIHDFCDYVEGFLEK